MFHRQTEPHGQHKQTRQEQKPLPSESPSSALPPMPHVATYTVEAGDDLRGIAQQVYGDSERWRTLFAANRGVLGEDPDVVTVVPGQVLVVPAW